MEMLTETGKWNEVSCVPRPGWWRWWEETPSVSEVSGEGPDGGSQAGLKAPGEESFKKGVLNSSKC